MTFDEARAQFPVLERYAYLNAGSNGPLARVTIDAFVEQAQDDLREGRSGKTYFDRMLALREAVRAGIAAVFGADPLSVALVESTTRGCSIVLAGLGLTGEDEVITTDQEHFGLTGTLFATGARVVSVEADEEAILGAITPRTRLIATSHVLWTTGRRLDLARLKRESGLPILVDGAQGAGAIPVDLSELDFYTVSAQKWLCAPDPAGALYVRDPTLLRVKTPSYFSQDSYEVSGAFVPKESAARFDSGWISVPGLAATVAALGTHPEWRYERAAEAAARCAALLAPHVDVVTPPGHSTLVAFHPNGDPAALVERLAEQDVIVRELPGRNLVRASCGWWTSDEDLDRLVAGVVS
ncbi:MAG TPA: aminotransferase class V-fold PLP-dependent enzyme [Gaiellaceae bacterium]|nr:aminotransferase class V-fold PLP-dependent enzyme [Gaiellaceae bacterium]